MTGPTLWPRTLPSHLRNDPLRQAEVRIYDALAAALTSKWTVFYSRPWLGLTRTGAEVDGEADFVIAHPEKGVLTVEVKGGGISYDPQNDSWLSQDRNSIRHRIKDPVAQARSAKHELLKRVQPIRGWPSGYVRFSHGVIFPDVVSPPGDLGADKPRNIFCCRAELKSDFAGWVEQRLSTGEDVTKPGVPGIRALEELLAKPIALRMPLGFVIADDDQIIESLTPRQFQVLNAIADLPRVATGGGAGTGKTILACEAARRFAEKGHRTLLTCRGSSLSEHIAERMNDTGVKVLAFEALCRELASAAGQTSGLGASMGEDEHASLLLRVAEQNPELKFDGIFVDEAQDFVESWWIALDALLKKGTHARMNVFFDTNQKLYGQVATQLKSFDLLPINLMHNMRNTQAIHSVAFEHYDGMPIYPEGPQGVSVAHKACQDADIVREIRDIVLRLTGRDEILPRDIAVLAPDDLTLQALAKLGMPAGMMLDTITGFKGLERSVVIVAATRAIADQTELAYVALSRARTHLILVGEQIILKWLAPEQTEMRSH